MKKVLTIKSNELYFYKDGIKHIVDYADKSTYPKNIKREIHSRLWGDISGLWGNISDLRGEINSELWGDISNLWGDITGIKGCVNKVKGNINNCELTDKERKKGVDIKDLIINI